MTGTKIKQYNKSVYRKAQAYLRSQQVKFMKPNRLCTSWKILHYGIKADESPNIDHIQSVIMYCDFSDYCTRFSSTFRAVEAFESLISIKKRNAAFWWESKSLREM
eukprot:82221_1